MSGRRAEVLRQRSLASLLLIVAIVVACGLRNVDPPAGTVPAAERAEIVYIGPGFVWIDGRPTLHGGKVAPGRHTVWLWYTCGRGSDNAFDLRLDMEFAAGQIYRVKRETRRERNAGHCVFELAAEPSGRLICRVETRPNVRHYRITAPLDVEHEACRAWGTHVYTDADYLKQAFGDDLPWPPPVPQPVADAEAMLHYARLVLWSAMRGPEWANRNLKVQLQREIGKSRPVFVMTHAVSLPNDPDGIVHGAGALLRRQEPPPRTWRQQLFGTRLPIDPAGIETGSLSLRLGPADTYHTRTIVVLFDDEAALDRFVARLRTDRPLTLDLDADPGWTIRYWDADDVLQPPRDGWRP